MLKKEVLAKQVERTFAHGVLVYKGYVDDPRNTDNSWMETVRLACNLGLTVGTGGNELS